jgi:hypothetical protein
MIKGSLKIHSLEHQNSLKTKGFFKTPLLGGKELKELENLFHTLFKEETLPNLFDSITGSPNAEIKKEIHHKVLEICQPFIEKIMIDYFPVIAMFYSKKYGQDTEGGMHIDPSMTIEGYHHIGIWIPLNGADETTGKMCFLKGAHNMVAPYHSLSIKSPFANISEHLKPLMECVSVKPGEAIFFDNNLLHYTQKNVSGKIRIAVIIKLIDGNAPLVSAFCNKQSVSHTIELYQHSLDYYISDYFQQDQVPIKSKLLEHNVPNPIIFSEEDVDQFKQ